MARILIHFGEPGGLAGWQSVDDVVMGGMSASRLRHDPAGHAVFEGVVSLARGGGFASVRCAPRDLSAPGIAAYVLSVRGDGRRYKLGLRTDDAFDGIQYQAGIEAPAGEWSLVRLSCADFRPTFRGRLQPGAPPLDPARVRQAGFLIADRQAGPFALAVRWVRAE